MPRQYLFLLAMFACQAVLAREVIEVDGGLISGGIDDGIRCFKGVPYAAPPIGDLRWRVPHPVVAWSGVRACDTYGPACPQDPYPVGSIYESPPWEQNEDCLTLNIWTNSNSTRRLPVMVWIHGGAWTRGSGAWSTYNGASLARRDVVVVTINYRLGALGFFAHPELSAESAHGVSGNQGIYDQIAALKWVQRNITRFGGDPERVTIFGESAGSWSVHALVATPLASGLFHRAIGQSGTRFNPSPPLRKSFVEETSAHDIGVAFARKCKVETLMDLRKLSVKDILQAKFKTQLTIDGRLFPTQLADIYAAGQQNKVPLIVGSNADEMTSLKSPSTIPDSFIAVARVLTERFGTDGFNAFKQAYQVTDNASARQAFIHLAGDEFFARGMRRWARFSSHADCDAYLYYFTRVPPGPQSDYLGAYHACEIQYAFDNLTGSEGLFSHTDKKLADTMAAYWVNFARTGNPNEKGLPEWPVYNPDSEDYVELGDIIQAKRHLLKTRLDFLDSIPPHDGN